jgi:energy-coupling factor transporter ATP-binding protein EcfA2
LSFFGAVPYVAFALVVRSILCGDVALLAAGRWLALRPDEELAYRSMLAAAPGALCASIALGLSIARGLWSWLDQVRAAEESSESFLVARLRGKRPWEIVLRQGLWLRRRRELGALLLGGVAAAALVDILSNTLIDSFRPPGFPTYPSLGAALFLRGLDASGAPATLPSAWQWAHAAAVLAALALLLAQTLPRRVGRAALDGGALRVGGKLLASGIASAHGLLPRPAVQWVLGASGSGKSTLLRAWAGQLRSALVVPQDPDEALPALLAGTDVALVARRAAPRGDRVLRDLLGRLADDRVERLLADPFTSVATLSRGERQRLATCLALVRARADHDCALFLDEPTSAQDRDRTSALLDCVRELLPPSFAGAGSLAIATHDPEPFATLLGDRGPRGVADQVLWLEEGRSHAFAVGATAPGLQSRRWDGIAPPPQGLRDYLAAMDSLLVPRAAPAIVAETENGAPLLPARAIIGGRSHAISPAVKLAGGELALLWGPSGCGKTTLLREMALRSPTALPLGYVAQDPARAFPLEMPAREILGPALEQIHLRRWFGEDLTADLLARPVGSLSEGERQRLLLTAEVARLDGRPASRARPRVLLLDEPFCALDPPARVRLMDALIAWLRAPHGHNAAVLVSHSPQIDLGLLRASGVPAVEWTISGEG